MAQRITLHVRRHHPVAEGIGALAKFVVLLPIFAWPIGFTYMYPKVMVPLIVFVVGMAWLISWGNARETRRSREQAAAEAAQAVTAPVMIPTAALDAVSTGRHGRV